MTGLRHVECGMTPSSSGQPPGNRDPRNPQPEPPAGSETVQLLERLDPQIPNDQPRLRSTFAAAVESARQDAARLEQLTQENQQLNEAYEALTQPANRIGTFLRWDDEAIRVALIVLGDQEFLAKVDPSLSADELVAGTRVALNEGYAVVRTLPASESGGLVKIGERLPDGRVRLGGDQPGSATRIVHVAAELANATLRAGDEARLDASGRFIVEHFPAQESRDYFLEDIPEIPWEAVGGQERAIRVIRDTIEKPLLYPEIFAAYDQKPIKGILLYGPPGCGKTLIGKATAHNLTKEYRERTGEDVREYFMSISGPKILNMWLGETERMVREIFRTAREKAKEGRLVFIFMDEAESVLRTRSSGRYLNISNTVVPQFCAELDGLQTLENVVLILTSNRPDYIDPAVLRPGRIDRKVKVERPDRSAASQILSIYLTDRLPYDPALRAQWDDQTECVRRDLVERTLNVLWEKTPANEFLKVSVRNGSSETLYVKDLLSGALLKGIVDRAKETAIQRTIELHPEPAGLSADDLAAAVRAEFRENEIFPKSDVTEDWLQLLDYPAENVVNVKPVGRTKGEDWARRIVV